MAYFDPRGKQSADFSTDLIAIFVHRHSSQLYSDHLFMVGGGETSSSSGRTMSLRKLGGVTVERLGGACRVLFCLTGRGLAFSFVSLARLRELTVVPVLSLRALGLSFVFAIVVVDVVVLRTDRFLVG